MPLPEPGTTSQPAGGGPASPQMWAIVELMGHQRIAGALSQDLTAGAPLVRIDVPDVVYLETVWRAGTCLEVQRRIPAHSRSLGAPAIFSIHWVDEATARLAAVSIKANPLKLVSLKSALQSLPEAEREQLLLLVRSSALIGDASEEGDDEHF